MILALPLIVVCVTGLLLNHTVDLKLDQRMTSLGWVLDRYGMRLQGDPVSFQAGNQSVSQWGGQRFLNDIPVDGDGEMLGVARLDQGLAVVSDTPSIDLFDADGDLLDQLGAVSLPDGFVPRRVGTASGGSLVIEQADGRVESFDITLLESATLSPGAEITWATSMPPSVDSLGAMQQAYRGEGVPWSRVLLDLHTGKLFGKVGTWLLDLATIGLLLLTVTGLRLALRPSPS